MLPFMMNIDYQKLGLSQSVDVSRSYSVHCASVMSSLSETVYIVWTALQSGHVIRLAA